jgi:hypothetical protein
VLGHGYPPNLLDNRKKKKVSHINLMSKDFDVLNKNFGRTEFSSAMG